MRFLPIAQAVSLIPGFWGMKIRYKFYKRYLKKVGKDVLFNWGCVLNYRDIEIGDNVQFGAGSHIGLVKIGNDVGVGQRVVILSGSLHHGFYRIKIPMIDQEGRGLVKIIIGDDVWIGAGSVIMADLPKGCLVSAGSVVKKKFKEYDILEGNPAKPIYNRLTRKKY